MIPTLMGAAVFTVGFLMLLIGLMGLLNVSGVTFNPVQQVFIYIGGIILCLLGYFMARRLPRHVIVEEPVETTVVREDRQQTTGVPVKRTTTTTRETYVAPPDFPAGPPHEEL